VDEAHETLSGPATKRILEREFEQYEDANYERLRSRWRISTTIYNGLQLASAPALPGVLDELHHVPSSWFDVNFFQKRLRSIGEGTSAPPENPLRC
jgi:hypothetical protein